MSRLAIHGEAKKTIEVCANARFNLTIKPVTLCARYWRTKRASLYCRLNACYPDAARADLIRWYYWYVRNFMDIIEASNNQIDALTAISKAAV